jgi:hypothetical protein
LDEEWKKNYKLLRKDMQREREREGEGECNYHLPL